MKNLILLVAMIFAAHKAFSMDTKVVDCAFKYDQENIVFAANTLRSTVDIKRKINELQYHIHIADINNFNEIEDYIEIVNKKGHSVTFSLKCK